MNIDITNIIGINYLETIKDVVDEIRKEYHELSTDKTCIIYSKLVMTRLKEKHVISRMVSSLDLGVPYDHRFVLAGRNNEFYLIDLTYNQFFDVIPEEFIELDQKGFIRVDKEKLRDYIISFTGIYQNENIDNLFFK